MLRIKDIREDKDLLQRDVAKILNISQTNYSKYELGKINIPINTLKEMAIFFNTSIDYLLGLTEEIKPYERNKNSNTNTNSKKDSTSTISVDVTGLSKSEIEEIKNYADYLKWKKSNKNRINCKNKII